MSSNKNDEEFQMTKEELDKFQKAMQNEEFRKMLVEYAQEISDPENKKKYEAEIAQMEKERGMDVKFVNPEGGFVVKTTRVQDGLKAFVNICYNEHIKKASSHIAEKDEHDVRKKGEQWSIPFSLSQPRDDLDNAGKKCVVFDVVFHPETYQKGQQDPRFQKLIINTALEGIQNQLNVKLNNKNLKFPKLKFKGVKQATVIRSKSNQQPDKQPDDELNFGGQTFPYPYSNSSNTESKNNYTNKTENKTTVNGISSNNEQKEDISEDNKQDNQLHEPVYHILHRGVIDFQNFTNARDSCTSTRPKELVVSIELPKLKSTATVELDIFEKQLVLHNDDPLYHLDLALPFPVDEANGHAKFDKSKRELVVTLPVNKPEVPSLSYGDLPSTEEEQYEALEEKQEEQNTNTSLGSTGASYLDSNSDEKRDITSDIADNIGDDNRCIETSNDSSKISDTNFSSIPSGIENQTLKSNSHDVDSSTNIKSDEGETKNPNIKETNHCNITDKSMKRSSELTNGVDNKVVSSDSIGNSVEEKSDWLIDDEGFVLMDDVRTIDDNYYGGMYRSKQMNGEDICFDLPADLSGLSSPFFFKEPPYSFHQDKDTVTFVIHVADVAMEYVSLGFNENKCYINFPSEKPNPHELPPPDYALYISFTEGHNLAADNCHIDVSKDNIVLTLAKDESCKGLWDSFKAGPGEEKLEDKFFITDNNVELMMQEIAKQDPWTPRSKLLSDVQVVSVDDDHLTVEVREKLADAVKENQENTGNKNHVEKVKQTSEQAKNMESTMIENLDLKEGVLSNKMHELQLQKLTSPDEGIEFDMYSHERREKYQSDGLTERIAASIDPKRVQEHGHKVNPSDDRRKTRSDSTDSQCSDRSDSCERRKSRSDSLDSVSSDRSDLAMSTSSIPVRKSCMRRSSSTSTDDDTDYELSNPVSPSNGSWGSPGKRNVRFNLNPSVRVFSNKKDKQRWKLEQRLKNQKLVRENSDDKEATIHEESSSTEADDQQHGVQHVPKRQDSESSVDEEWTIVDKPAQDQSLSNNLIFALDD